MMQFRQRTSYLTLLLAAHESEKNRIINIILQKREKLDINNDQELFLYKELTDLIDKIQK